MNASSCDICGKLRAPLGASVCNVCRNPPAKPTLPRVRLYRNPETSESSGEWDTFVEAFTCADPLGEFSVLVSNGETLARGYDATGGGRWGWTATPEGLARARDEYNANQPTGARE